MDRIAQVQRAVKAARSNGWEVIGNNTIRRMSEHVTPSFARKNDWWDAPVYPAVELMSFVFFERTRAPKVVYKLSYNPWTGTRDGYISFRRCLDLLAEPEADSAVHRASAACWQSVHN